MVPRIFRLKKKSKPSSTSTQIQLVPNLESGWPRGDDLLNWFEKNLLIVETRHISRSVEDETIRNSFLLSIFVFPVVN
jgi:hypothetical protein